MPPPPSTSSGPYAAFLRVYEPLTAFPAVDRAEWASYVSRSREAAATRDSRLAAEHRSALARAISAPPRPVPTEEAREAFVLELDGIVHVCPVQVRLRSWVALGQFRDGLPDTLLHAFVPPAALERADADHARWGRSEAGTALRILTATWCVPVQWFVPFAASDQVSEGSAAEAMQWSGLHRTRMSAARRRVARALRTMRRSVGDLLVVEELEELGRWLEEFHARSWLELDYAGLGWLLEDGRPERDRSVADVAEALAALAAGDDAGAATAYRRVVARWAPVAALAHAS